ncbi:MAG: glycoside hydrolase family 65 protein [Spirochaetales bacterium]|nr:glycoside hydrolase family 65 protein [Spirochaetales bacterium]
MIKTVLTNEDPLITPSWEAFIGNGYIGQRIAIEGDYSHFDDTLQRPGFWDDRPFPSGSVMNGLWGESGLEYLPRWCTLKLGVGSGSFGTSYVSRRAGSYDEYKQDMNLNQGIVRTKALWSTEDKDGTKFSLKYQTEVYLARHDRNTAVIEMTITPHFDGWITVEDILDASMCDSFQAVWQKEKGQTISLTGNLGEKRREIEIHSMTGLINGEIPELLPHPYVEIPSIDYRLSDRGIRKMIYLQAEKDIPVAVRKVVGIYSDQDSIIDRAKAIEKLADSFMSEEKLRHDHCRAWEKLWHSRIETDNTELQETSDLILYLFYSQLEENRAYALGPLGITGGECWRGRLFWDGDLWMFPGINLLNPRLAKGFVDIRANGLKGAIGNAAKEGRKGARFAWESTDSGMEKCTGYEVNQVHLNSAVCLAHERYYLASGDEKYRREISIPILEETVEYWLERISFNEEKNRYEIKSISCPDEFSGIVNNNSLTNYAAVKDIRRLISFYETEGMKIPETWKDIIEKMHLPRNESGLILEYENYNGHTIKQADTTLLIYPYEMNLTIREINDLVEYYSIRTEKKGIMMSGVIDGIAYALLGKPEKLWEAFEKTGHHFHGPFKVSTETPHNNNQWFMTGLGGILQLILIGMAGIRQTAEGLKISPCLPQQIGELSIYGLFDKGERFNLSIRRTAGGIIHNLKPLK